VIKTGQTINTGLVQTSVTTTSTFPNFTNRIVYVAASASCDTSYDTIYTCPAGKVFFLCGVSVFTGAAKTLYLGIDGTDSLVMASNAADLWARRDSSVPLLRLTAGQVLAGKTSTGSDVFYIYGYYVDA